MFIQLLWWVVDAIWEYKKPKNARVDSKNHKIHYNFLRDSQ